jgi:hypothetical protein
MGNTTVGMAGIVLRKKAAGLLHDFNPGDWQSLEKVVLCFGSGFHCILCGGNVAKCTSRTYVWPVGVCRASVPRRSACGMHSARPHSLPFPAPCTVAHVSCVLKQQSALRCTLFRPLRSYPEVCMRVGDLGRAEGRVPAHIFIGYCLPAAESAAWDRTSESVQLPVQARWNAHGARV